MYDFRVRVHEEAGTFWSECLDIPEAHSVGDTREQLLANAVEGITLALTIYVEQGRKIPQATARLAGESEPIPLPAQTVTKIVLWNEICDRGMRVADLARHLGISHPVASRLVDFEHNSKIEQIEAALKTLNRSISVQPIDPTAVRIEFYPTINEGGNRTVLVKRNDVPFSEIPENLVKIYKNVPHQDDVINVHDLKSRWWLTPDDGKALLTKGWSAFSFGLPVDH
ncbi:hypothetical protein JJQ97_20715 [Pseudomonas syringae]|uniref:type II toxin-antitoxin system HicB family antitoxin n=1 Tax=Pseudomonas syringae TaxID=317 RepID=UPI0019170E91|nr:type II toxin-antitoxin system HicB family antitoxin [Pseudomonas syringae]QQQ49738.1 hypothetical protein JJQ97_20715 [Pseudomonas syringae]